MPSRCPSRTGWFGTLATGALASLLSLMGPAQADPLSGDRCPLVVPPSQSLLQPRKIRPDQVKAKNAMGCLSPADAVYGPNGCPQRLCGPDAGVIQLPDP